MDAITLLKTRRSCRSFTTEQVREEDLQAILDCGLNAPSARNGQDTKIVVLQDPALIQTLSDINGEIWGQGKDPFYGAPTVCLILAPKANANGVQDGSLVIGAMQAAAYAIGVGSCWINRCKEMLEDSRGENIKVQWGLADYQGVGCCALGYPTEPAKDLPRKPDRVLRK